MRNLMTALTVLFLASCGEQPIKPPPPPPAPPSCLFDGITIEFRHAGAVYKAPMELDLSVDSPSVGDEEPNACRWHCPEAGGGEGSTVTGYFFCAWKKSCRRTDVASHVYFGPNWHVGKARTVDRDVARCSKQVFEVELFDRG